MNRNASNVGREGSFTLRGPALAVMLTVAGSSLAACVDLFHSTDFVSCAPCDDAGVKEASVADASVKEASVADARRPDAAKDSSAHDGHTSDVTIAPPDAGPDVSMAHDAGRDSDGGHDAPGSHDAGVDATKAVDAGTDFCTFTTAEPAAYAEHACLWLAACAGNEGLNEYGACYTNALFAYDCALNPDQRIRGALHAYWDALAHATNCTEVLAAIFSGAAPSCTLPAGVPECGNELGNNAALESLSVTCTDDGTFASAINCTMAGHTCINGSCGNSAAPCGDASSVSCSGSILRACQPVEVEAGSAVAIVDVGRDCTLFGAGACAVADGVGGCLPNEAGAQCEPSLAVTCLDGGVATGCATGSLERVRCGELATNSVCGRSAGWAASSAALAGGCENAGDLGTFGGPGGCLSGGQLTDPAGPAGIVAVDCKDAGFAACKLSSTGQPYCPAE